MATEEAETSVHATLLFLQRELAIATELVHQVVLLRCHRIGRLGWVLLQCHRRVQGAASGQTGGCRLSTPVVVQGRGGGRHFWLFGLGIRLGGGTGFSCNLVSAFPISLVEAQDKLSEGIKGNRFQVVNHLILETFRKGQVCAMEQSGFTVFITELRDNHVEFHKEPNSLMVIFHYQLFQFGFHITEVGLEFGSK